MKPRGILSSKMLYF